MHQLLGIYICEKTIIMIIILLLLIPQTTSCPPVMPINAFPSQHSIEKWYITHLSWKTGDQPNLLSNSLFSGVLTGLLVPSSKITKLLDTPCNTPSCWKVSGKAFLMQKTQQKPLDGFEEMQQASWATGNKSHYSENATWKYMFHMFCMHVHMVEVKWFSRSLSDCQAHSIWKDAHDAKYYASQIYGSEILHTRSAWQFIPRLNTFFLPSLQCLADHIFSSSSTVSNDQ